MKSKLILAMVLALGAMAHAQGFVSNLSVSGGVEGVFPSSTFTRGTAETTNGFNANTQSTTNSAGYTASARYDFGRHSAFEISGTYNRNSELFESGEIQGLARVTTNNTEIIGSYIYRLPSRERIKPYALVGGGMVHFSPNNSFTTGTAPSSQSKPVFAYGFGSDLKVNDSWGVRLQYRGLIRSEPDFGLSNASTPFGSGLKVHVAEPSIEVMYHF